MPLVFFLLPFSFSLSLLLELYAVCNFNPICRLISITVIFLSIFYFSNTSFPFSHIDFLSFSLSLFPFFFLFPCFCFPFFILTFFLYLSFCYIFLYLFHFLLFFLFNPPFYFIILFSFFDIVTFFFFDVFSFFFYFFWYPFSFKSKFHSVLLFW